MRRRGLIARMKTHVQMENLCQVSQPWNVNSVSFLCLLFAMMIAIILFGLYISSIFPSSVVWLLLFLFRFSSSFSLLSGGHLNRNLQFLNLNNIVRPCFLWMAILAPSFSIHFRYNMIVTISISFFIVFFSTYRRPLESKFPVFEFE